MVIHSFSADFGIVWGTVPLICAQRGKKLNPKYMAAFLLAHSIPTLFFPLSDAFAVRARGGHPRCVSFARSKSAQRKTDWVEPTSMFCRPLVCRSRAYILPFI